MQYNQSSSNNSTFTPPEHLKHYFDEKEDLINKRRVLVADKRKYTKKRDSAIFGIIICVLFAAVIIPLVIMVFLIIKVSKCAKTLKVINYELYQLNQRLTELGIEYKEEYAKTRDDYDPNFAPGADAPFYENRQNWGDSDDDGWNDDGGWGDDGDSGDGGGWGGDSDGGGWGGDDGGGDD